MDSLEHGAVAVGDHVQVLEHRLPIPASGHAGREQRLDLRGDVERVAHLRVEEGLDAEAVARREEEPVVCVPEGERELSTQLAQTVRPELFVEVDQDLAVRPGAEPVASLFEVPLVALEVVELAVDDDVDPLVLVRDRLVAGPEVDDREPRMPEAHAAIRRDPLPVPVGPAVIERARGAAQGVRGNRRLPGEDGDDAAHGGLRTAGRWVAPAARH
jgi:hypothetical protein